jgi:Spirocyclase AveC-like
VPISAAVVRSYPCRANNSIADPMSASVLSSTRSWLVLGRRLAAVVTPREYTNLRASRYLSEDRYLLYARPPACYRHHMSHERSLTMMAGEVVDSPGPDPVQAQRTWAKVWIVHGFAWLALIAYCWSMWVISGDFHPNTLGRGQEPVWYVVVVRCVEVIFGVIITGWILWHFVIGPKLRTGRLSFDGLFFLAGWLMFFQEPWIDWITYQFQYATTFVNFGSWLPHIPGWSSGNGQLIPVPMVYFTAYLWMCAMSGYAGSKYMTYQRRKDPSRSVFRLIAQTYLVMIVGDVIVELIMTRTGLISYSSTIPSLTLFAGTDHQFPLYEPLALFPRRPRQVVARAGYRQSQIQARRRQNVRSFLRHRRRGTTGDPDRVQHPVFLLRIALRTNAHTVCRATVAQRRGVRSDNRIQLRRSETADLAPIRT